MSDAVAVAVDAPAKINLYLHVTGRRPDGYHLLDSAVVFTALADRVTAVPAAPGAGHSLTLRGPFGDGLADGADNLVLRAAAAFTAATGRVADVALTLDKRLPIAAGIGGGSSDAAATLLAMNALADGPLTSADLARIGLALGADVPMCITARPARIGGIGEQVTPLALPDGLPLVLVNPGVAVATPDVFRTRQGEGAAAAALPEALPHDPAGLAALLGQTRNCLTAAASTLAPAITAVLDALAARPGCHLARMSGSGATCFGLFSDAEAARAAAAFLGAAQPGWWCQATQTASRAAPRAVEAGSDGKQS